MRVGWGVGGGRSGGVCVFVCGGNLGRVSGRAFYHDSLYRILILIYPSIAVPATIQPKPQQSQESISISANQKALLICKYLLLYVNNHSRENQVAPADKKGGINHRNKVTLGDRNANWISVTYVWLGWFSVM